jgi:hypothetical protein
MTDALVFVNLFVGILSLWAIILVLAAVEKL